MSTGTSVSKAAAASVADQAQLAHVRHVEQRGLVAAVPVLGEDAGGVLHRHRIAGEGHHAAPSSTCRQVAATSGTPMAMCPKAVPSS
jgi:hypothetical protein